MRCSERTVRGVNHGDQVLPAHPVRQAMNARAMRDVAAGRPRPVPARCSVPACPLVHA